MIVDNSKLTRDYEIFPLKRGYSSRYGSQSGEIPCYADVYYLYITLNMNLVELGAYFGRKRDSARLWITHHNIIKDQDLILKKMENTRQDRYGDAHYNNIQKSLDTKLSKYGKRGTGEGTKKFYATASAEEIEDIVQRRKQTCLRKYGYDNHMKNPEWKFNWLRQLSRKITKPEKQICEFFDANNIEYKFQYVLRYENHIRMYDWYLPKYNLLVEFDGAFWHRLDKQILNDQLKNHIAKEMGYRLVRIKGESNMNLLWELQ